jgi:predicted transcriptional regulator
VKRLNNRERLKCLVKGANALGLSRMEKYIAIIKVLNNWDSITQKQILRKADLNLVSPKEYLNFLVKLDLIREETLGNKTSYSITYKGQRLCTYFRLKDNNSIFGGTRIMRID